MSQLDIFSPLSRSGIALALPTEGAPPPPPPQVPIKKPDGDKLKVKLNSTDHPTASHYQTSNRGERQIVISDADFYCLDGFELNHDSGRCERDDEKPADMGCPMGWDFEENQCTTTVVRAADRFCGEGYEDVRGRCQRQMRAPKQLVCPPAYRPTEYGCLKDVTTEPIVSCKDGTSICRLSSPNLLQGSCIKVLVSV